MTEHDDELRDLLTDAVADVEPEYRLDTIRARTQRPPRRRGWYAVGGAVLAAAAVVTAVNLGQDHGGRPDPLPPAGQGETHAVALYFVGDTPQGPRLYREFQQLPDDPVASLEAITTAFEPDDPDYCTSWPAGIFKSVAVKDGVIAVELGPSSGPRAKCQGAGDLRVQQVVYTVQAATGEDLPVDFVGQGPVFLELDAPAQRQPQNEVLALVSVSDPAEGTHVSGTFVARGRANSFEATVPWEIRASDGTTVENGFATAAGYGDHLFRWETDPIDVSDFNPGRFTFVAMTDDPSGGEGSDPFTDTRTIIVD